MANFLEIILNKTDTFTLLEITNHLSINQSIKQEEEEKGEI